MISRIKKDSKPETCAPGFACAIAARASPVEYETYTPKAGPRRGMNSIRATLRLFKKIPLAVGVIPFELYPSTPERIMKTIANIFARVDRSKFAETKDLTWYSD